MVEELEGRTEAVLTLEVLRDEIMEVLKKDPLIRDLRKEESRRKVANKILLLCKEAGLRLLI